MSARSGVLRFQFSRMLRSKAWRYALVVGLVVSAVCFAQTCLLFWGHDIGEVPSADVAWVGNYESMQTPLFTLYLVFLMPFLSAAVFGDSFFNDVRRRFAACVVSRSSLRAYVASGAVAASVGGFLVVLVPLAVSQLLAFVAFPVAAGQDVFQLFVNTSAATADVTAWYRQTLFPGLFLNHRYLLNALFIVYDALWGGLLALASFVLSLYLRVSRLLVVGVPALALIVSTYLMPTDFNVARDLMLSLVMPRNPVFFALAPVAVGALLVAAAAFALRSGRDVLL